MKKQENNVYLSIAGIMAPVLWFGLVIIFGLLEPGYSHMTKTMSVLGGVGGIRGIIFNLGLSLVGLLIISFAVGLHKNINRGKGSKVGPILLILGGVGMILSGIFHCNLNCTNALLETDFIGIMHMLFAFIAGMCLAIFPFFIFARLRKDPQWKNYKWFTLIMGILSNIPTVVLWITIFTVGAPKEIGGMMSYRMLRLSLYKK